MTTTDDPEKLGGLSDIKGSPQSTVQPHEQEQSHQAMADLVSSRLSSPMMRLELEAGEMELLDVDSIRRVHYIEGSITLYSPDMLIQILGNDLQKLLIPLQRRALDCIAIGKQGVTHIVRYDADGNTY